MNGPNPTTDNVRPKAEQPKPIGPGDLLKSTVVASLVGGVLGILGNAVLSRANIDVAGIQANVQKQVAEMQAVSNKQIADVQAEMQEKVADVQAASEERVAALQARVQQNLAEMQRGAKFFDDQTLPKVKAYVEDCVNGVSKVQIAFETLIQFSDEGAAVDWTSPRVEDTKRALGELYKLRTSERALWTNIVNPELGKVLQDYNNALAQSVGAMSFNATEPQQRRDVMDKSRELERKVVDSLQFTLMRINEIGTASAKSRP